MFAACEHHRGRSLALSRRQATSKTFDLAVRVSNYVRLLPMKISQFFEQVPHRDSERRTNRVNRASGKAVQQDFAVALTDRE